MEIRSTLIFLFFVSLFVIGFACKDNFIEQPNDPDAELSYLWTVDTLYYTPSSDAQGNTLIYDLWGAVDTCVFAVGRDEYGGLGAMWRFNGNHWQRVKLFLHEGGSFGQALSFTGLLGFSSTNIYALGNHFYSNPNPPPNYLDSSMAAHYDGFQWKEIPVPKGKLMYGGAGYSEETFYVGGTDGQLFNYKNGIWSVDTIRHSFFPAHPYYNIMPLSCASEGVFLITNQYDPASGNIYDQLLLYTDTLVSILDSTSWNDHKWGGGAYWRSPSGRIYSCGSKGVFVYDDGRWENVYDGEPINSVHGTADNRMFALGSSGNVFFYNGNSWTIIRKIDLTPPIVGKLWSTKRGVFISVYKNMRSYVFHGYR